jgi:hypothetical protein
MKINKFINFQRPGNLSFEDNKLRVSTENDITSVLFEDISSLSVRKGSGVNFKFVVFGIISLFIGYIISKVFYVDIEMSFDSFNLWKNLKSLFYLGGVVLFILSFINREYWDNVVVETRGGQLIIFSVLEGDGLKYLEDIELKKRRVRL